MTLSDSLKNRRKVDGLAAALQDPALRDRSIELLRHALKRVATREEPGCFVISLDGAIVNMVSLASRTTWESKQAVLDERTACSVELVAGRRSD